MARHSGADAIEVAIERVHHVVGKLRLGKRGEIADVRKQDRHAPVLAHAAHRGARRFGFHQEDVLGVQNEPPQRHVPAHAGLAGEADVRAEVAVLGQPRFALVARAAVVQPLGYQHPAGGALGVAAADVRVRDAVIERRAQKRSVAPDFYGPAIRQVLDSMHTGIR